jgi:branched-chain amino acid transport system ATP-binding protein
VTSVLEMRDIRAGYGGADILHGVSITVQPGEIVVIVGPNGAGKSTLMKAAFGLVTAREGRIFYDGAEITNLAPERIVARGIGYVPQENNVFPTMSVQENLEMGAFLRGDDFRSTMERVFALFPRLKERRRQSAGSMSGGERQMVAMGRALMAEPKLILLDEPTAGLAPALIQQTFERILAINHLGVAVLMIEQNARQALRVADRGYVLAMGRNRHEGTGAALLADPEIADLFLGGKQ